LADLPPRALHLAAQGLRLQAPPFAARRRLRGDAPLRSHERGTDDLRQTFARDLAVAGLAPCFLGADHDGAVERPASPREPLQPRLDGRRQVRAAVRLEPE